MESGVPHWTALVKEHHALGDDEGSATGCLPEVVGAQVSDALKVVVVLVL